MNEAPVQLAATSYIPLILEFEVTVSNGAVQRAE